MQRFLPFRLGLLLSFWMLTFSSWAKPGHAPKTHFSFSSSTSGHQGLGSATSRPLTAPTSLTLYVKVGGSGTGDGSSWTNASGDLQAMINASVPGGQVWVAQGTYKPTTSQDPSISFSMKTGVAIYGSFVGSETSPNQRPAFPNGQPTTKLSSRIGEILTGPFNTLHGPIYFTMAINSESLIYNQNVASTAILDGFLITGDVSEEDVVHGGRGMFNDNSNPTLINCTFQSNLNDVVGAGIFNQNFSSPLLINCSFINNHATLAGSAIANVNTSSPLLVNCSFQGNFASAGSIIYNQNKCSPILTNCLLYGNSGSAFYNLTNDSQTLLRYCLVETGTTGFMDLGNNLTTTSSPFISDTDLRLKAQSPAIDAGTNEVNTTRRDLAGNARIYNNTIDIGAYEYQGADCQALVITSQPPSSSAICAGASVTAMVSVTGSSPTYQWYKDGQLVSGQTSAILSLTGVQPNQQGAYSVGVTGACNSVTSTAFTLSVNNPFTVNFVNNESLTCAKTSVTLTTTGGPSGATYTYSSGATASATSSATATVSQAGPYSVTVTAPGGCSATVTTVVASNTIAPTVSITPSTTIICSGQSAQLTASGATAYVWNTGQTTNPIAATASGTYSVTGIATNGCRGTAFATVTVNRSLTITSQSQSVSTICGAIAQDTPFSFGVEVAGTGPYTYTLFRDGVLVDRSNPLIFDNLIFGPATRQPGNYQIVVTTACNSATTTFAPVVISPLPVQYAVKGGGSYCQGGSGVPVTLPGSQTGVTYQLLLNNQAVGSPLAGTGNPLLFGSQRSAGSYTVQATNTSTNCQQLMTGSVSVTVNPLPMVYSIIGGGAYCAGGSGVEIRLAGSQTGISYQLQRDGTTVGIPIVGAGNPLSFGNQTSAGTYTVLAIDPTTTCQQPMSGSATVTITPLPSAPTVVTQRGYPYPAGVSSLTIAQNVGPVSLTASGCSGGMLTANGNAASSLTISTAITGTQTYTATCTQNGCTSPMASFQLTVVHTTLSVLHRDADYGNTQNNIIKPYLELANAGSQAVPYSDITVRYWFTSEGNAPPTNLAVYYAQLGMVNMKYVALSQPRQGAYGYVEYSFPGGGSLAGNGNSGPIENGIQKTDGSNFDESDDYSYQANYQDYVPNQHVTAYRKGADGVPVLVWGQEPTSVASQTAVQVYSQAKDGTITSQIQTRLELRNTGNVALLVSNLKLRYYFTSDNGQLANVYVDYADIGASNVAATVVKLAVPVNGADSYVELSFPGNAMQVNAQSSLGAIDFRLVRSDYGLFDQSNDYSFLTNYGNVGLNNRVTAYLNNTLIFGTPPSGAPARVVVQEVASLLQARLLGNPVMGSHAEVEITGVTGQAVNLMVIDLQGRAIHEQRVEQAGETERVSLPLGSSQGQLLLRVNTADQQRSLKLLRP